MLPEHTNPMSLLVTPMLANTSVTTGMSISTSLRWSSRRTDFDWATDTTADGPHRGTRRRGALTGTP